MRNILALAFSDPKRSDFSGVKPVSAPGRTTHACASCGTSETARKDAISELSDFRLLRFAAGATRRKSDEEDAETSIKRVRRATKYDDANR